MSTTLENIPDNEDAKDIRDYISGNYELFYHGLKALREYNFSIGDILIKNTVEEDYDTGVKKLKPVCVSHNNPTPRKFKVVAIDEFGIPWIRQISSSTGELGIGLESLASFTVDAIRFTPDRAQAESILMGDEAQYSPIEAAKAHRKLVIAMRKRNGKKIIRSKDPESSAFWAEQFKSLKRSQEVWFRKDVRWMGSNGTYFKTSADLEECKVRVMSVKTITTIKELKEHQEVIGNRSEIQNAAAMIKANQEVVIMRFVGKDYSGNWNSARNASYATNCQEGYYNDLTKFALYVEEPEF